MNSRIVRHALSLCIGIVCIGSYFLKSLFVHDAIIGTFPDACEVVWTIWFTKQYILGAAPDFYFSKLIFYPFGSSLYLHATVELITFPLTAILLSVDPRTIYNIACVLCFIFNFLSAYILLSLCTQKIFTVLLFSLILTFHPWFIGHLDGGQLNFLCFFPVLLLHYGLIKLIMQRRDGLHEAALSGLSVAAMAYSNLYYLYFSIVALSLWALTILIVDRVLLRQFITRLYIPALGGLILALPKLIGVASLALKRTHLPDHQAWKHSADILSLLLPGANQILGGVVPFNVQEIVRVNSAEAGCYIGISVILLLIYGRKFMPAAQTPGDRALFWGGGVLAFIFISLALGPQIEWGTYRIAPGWLYQLFDLALPFFPSVPARFTVFGILYLFILASCVVERSQQLSPRFSGFLVLLALVEYAPVSIRTQVRESSPLLREIAARSDITAIHDVVNTPWEAMIHQIDHEKPITEAFISRRPKEPLKEYKRSELMRALRSDSVITDVILTAGLDKFRIDGLIVPKTGGAALASLSNSSVVVKVLEDDKRVVFVRRER